MAQNLGVNVVGLHPRLRESFRLFELSPENVQHTSSPLYRNLKLSQSPGVQTPRLLGAKLGANLFCKPLASLECGCGPVLL
jgi:hypothetical protein